MKRTAAFVDWTLRYGRWIWLVALLLGVPATWRTAQLYAHIKSDLEELLPREAPSVQALSELRARMPGLQYLGVVVDVGDGAHLPDGERFIDDLAARIRRYPPSIAGAVRTGTTEERTFLEAHAPLYVDVEDLRAMRARIEARRDYEVTHATGSSLDDDTAPPLDFSDVEKKYEAKVPKRGAQEGDRFSSHELHLTMLLIEVGAFETGSKQAKELLTRVKADMAALGGTDAYAPGMRVGFSGDAAISVEELDALISDLSISTVLVILAVVAIIILYYRWARSVIVLVPPLLLAAVYAIAVASLPPFNVTELNSNTAFLGSIIIGNGINFGIVLLARYVEERREGRELRPALITAVGSARIGTLSAALAAGVAYVSLMSTQFRGFRQFGIIGGIGMVLSWAVAFVCMPPLIAWLDRKGSAAALPHEDIELLGAVGNFVRKFPVLIVAVALVLTLLSTAKVSSFGADQIETDFSRLRRKDTWAVGEGYWGARMDNVLGAYLTPTIVVADSRDQATSIAAELKEEMKHPPLSEMIAELRTVDDVVPSHQEEKLAEIAAIREAMTPAIRALIPPDKQSQVDRLLGTEDLSPFTIAQLPRSLTTGLIERDGTSGRTILVFPRMSKALWQGPPLVALVTALREAASVGGPRPARVAGSLPLSADILASVRRDGPRASALAFFGVLVVVLGMVRKKSAGLYVIASLTVAVLWLGALTMLLGVKVNFANFIAFPITFGIGADYAVNVMTRYVQDGRRDIVGTIRATGSAVALCSLATIIGYSSLLVAENRALFYFGLVAVLGEVACLTTAVTLLPAVLMLVDRRRAARQQAHP
ncbi:MAG: exporters of the superfamily [Myxococcaceae bacterium]|nr:exporters of the superfamily [Myxococcaceae bacterium]